MNDIMMTNITLSGWNWIWIPSTKFRFELCWWKKKM